MKWSILFLALLLFVSTNKSQTQKYGLGNTNPSVFTKFRIPETDLSTIWFSTNLYLNSFKKDYYYLEPEVPRSGSEFNSSLRFNLDPNYYLLRESEDNYLSLRASLSGSFFQEYIENHSSPNQQKTTEHTKDYSTFINLSFTDNNYINQNDLFYSLGSVIQVSIADSRIEFFGHNTYDGSKYQNYSFSIGMGQNSNSLII
jgi:hypothetical protein